MYIYKMLLSVFSRDFTGTKIYFCQFSGKNINKINSSNENCRKSFLFNLVCGLFYYSQIIITYFSLIFYRSVVKFLAIYIYT